MLRPGLKANMRHVVAAGDLASSWQNDIPVFATPILLWLAELTCMRAVEGNLEPQYITAGYRHDVYHSAPTPEGWVVDINAELIVVDDKLLTFKVSAHDGIDVILSGKHTRALLDRERFLRRLQRKSADSPEQRSNASRDVAEAK